MVAVGLVAGAFVPGASTASAVVVVAAVAGHLDSADVVIAVIAVVVFVEVAADSVVVFEVHFEPSVRWTHCHFPGCFLESVAAVHWQVGLNGFHWPSGSAVVAVEFADSELVVAAESVHSGDSAAPDLDPFVAAMDPFSEVERVVDSAFDSERA